MVQQRACPPHRVSGCVENRKCGPAARHTVQLEITGSHMRAAREKCDERRGTGDIASHSRIWSHPRLEARPEIAGSDRHRRAGSQTGKPRRLIGHRLRAAP